tara:strand:- start:347 stop:544 length:198 start_codon:yes stop_codon:yes gene_type:complete
MQLVETVETPQDLAREFWDRKNEYHIQMYEYGRYSPETFIKHMMFLGWDRDELVALMEEDDEYVE